MSNAARPTLILVLTAVASTFACTTSPDEGVESSDQQVTTTARIKPEWKGPTPGTKNNDIDGKLVLDAWKKVKETFYDNRGLKTFDRQGNVVDVATGIYPHESEAAQCLGNPVPWWSDLMLHFYCWMPSYANVTPNVRGCFSYVTRAMQGPTPPPGQQPAPGYEQRMLFYPEVYDYCLYQDYDYVKSTMTGTKLPVFDTDEIDRNKAAGNKVGVMKWVDDNIGDAYKHVMFTWYDPDTYDMAQQQAIINAFYGVDLGGKPSYTAADTAQVNECRSKRPVQALDLRDGTHCSHSKRLTQSSLSANAAQAVQYMTNHVRTLPYTKSDPPPPPPTEEHVLEAGVSGKCADVAAFAQHDGGIVQQWACSGNDNQKWLFQDQGGGRFRIASKHSRKCLDVVNGSTADGAAIHQWSCKGGTSSQLWKIVTTSNRRVQLVNVSSGKCLDVTNGSTSDGTPLQQWSCGSSPSMEWTRE